LRALLSSLYLERFGEDDNFKTLQDLLKRARGVEEKRNQITHSFWGAGSYGETITRLKFTAKEKHGIKFHSEDVSCEDLSTFVGEIKMLASDILYFLIALSIKNKPFKTWV
jgi:hypothetical protein